MAGTESKGSRRYDKESLLWQFTVAIRSDPVGLRIDEGWQAANRKDRAAMTRKTYCGNLLWQSGLFGIILLAAEQGGNIRG